MVKQFFIKMALALGFLALFSLKFVDVSIGEHLNEYPLEIGWKAVGLPLQEVATETWMQLNNQWMTVYELKELTNEIENKLQITPQMKPTCGEQNDITYASFEGKRTDGTIVTVTIQSTRSINVRETQLGINTSHSGTIKNLGGYVTNLENSIKILGKEPHIKVLLFGEYQGKLESNIIKEFSSRVFQKIKAEYIDSAYEGGNSNQKGFTKLITDSITYDSRRVNVEIGTRYDQDRNTTQIVLASPGLGDGV